MRRKTLVGTASILTMMAANCVAVAGQPAGRAGESAYAEILAGLGSPDFEVRESWQKKLGEIGWQQREVLVKLAAGTADEEVKTRLLRRVDDIDEELATNPPPISLDLKNSQITEVENALAKATGLPALPRESYNRDRPEETFTLHAENQPFWTVFDQLTRQHPLVIRPNYSGWRLHTNVPAVNPQAPGEYARDLQTTGCFGYWQGVVERQDFRGAPAVLFHYNMIADPRVQAVRVSVPVWKEIVDELGNHWSDTHTPLFGAMTSQRSAVWSRFVALDVPPGAGTQIVSMKGEIKAVLAWGAESKVIAAPEKCVGQKIELGTAAVTFTKFDVKENRNDPRGSYRDVNFTVKVDSTADGAPVPVRVQVFEGTNIGTDTSCLAGMGARGETSAGFGGTAPGELTVRLSCPTKTKEVVLPLGFKNVALPKN